MSKIYLREGVVLHGKEGYKLIRQAAAEYMQRIKYKGLNINEIIDIVNHTNINVYDAGKPYFDGLDIKFSVSHTGPMWMCIIDDKPCGLDIQQVKSCKYEAIAERHFSEEEIAYVSLWGEEGFFDVWTAKEAFGKYTGRGIFGEKESVVDETHELKDIIIHGGKSLFMKRIMLSPELKCTYCTETDEISDVILL